MFHYDGPQPHQRHSHAAATYGSYVDDADPAHAAFAQAGYEVDERQTESEAGSDDEAAGEPSHQPPSSYMHEGFLHHVPEWMKQEADQHRDIAHRGGNTAEDRLLAHRRRQEQMERERELQKDAL